MRAVALLVLLFAIVVAFSVLTVVVIRKGAFLRKRGYKGTESIIERSIRQLGSERRSRDRSSREG